MRREVERLLFSAAFRVNGMPKAQPRPRAFAKAITGPDGAAKFKARVFEAGTAEAWKGDVIRCAEPFKPSVPLDGVLQVDIDLFLPRPGKLMSSKFPDGVLFAPVKPDRDNADKAILDALKIDGWFRDDCIVCLGAVRKFYHSKSGIPGAVIRIEELHPSRTSSILKTVSERVEES